MGVNAGIFNDTDALCDSEKLEIVESPIASSRDPPIAPHCARTMVMSSNLLFSLLLGLVCDSMAF